MSEKPAPERFDERAIAARDDVHVHGAGLRCPFCHDGVDVGATDAWVACERCLARQHEPCWGEAGRCGGCGHGVALAGRLRPEPAPRGSHTPWLSVLLGAVGMILVLVMSFVVYVARNGHRTREGMNRDIDRAQSAAWFEARRTEGGPRRIEVADGYAVVDRRGDWIFVDTTGGASSVAVGLRTMFVDADGESVQCRTWRGMSGSISRAVLRSADAPWIRDGEEVTQGHLTPEQRAALVAALAAPPGEVDIAALLAEHGYKRE